MVERQLVIICTYLDILIFYYQENGQDKVVFGYQIKGINVLFLVIRFGDPTKIRTATHEF